MYNTHSYTAAIELSLQYKPISKDFQTSNMRLKADSKMYREIQIP
jgi:hypothetical protein